MNLIIIDEQIKNNCFSSALNKTPIRYLFVLTKLLFFIILSQVKAVMGRSRPAIIFRESMDGVNAQ
jgi:hypothetical protein